MQAILLTWVGGEHPFALAIGNLRAVQKYCDAGPAEIYNRLVDGKWRVDDLFETIRQGLIGAGMEASEAGPLVSGVMERHPLFDFVLTAQAILASALVGEVDDPLGKPKGTKPSPENGASPDSTAPAR